MSRKDMILIAVIINAGLLAILFATAMIYDPDPLKTLEQSEMFPVAEVKAPAKEQKPILIATGPVVDEVDHALKSYVHPINSYVVTELPSDPFIKEPALPIQPTLVDEGEAHASVELTPHGEGFIEVSVKKGDVLEKIAKTHKTTVNAIKKANQLQGERLQIGQVLKIPLKKESSSSAVAEVSHSIKKPVDKKEIDGASDQVYYTIKAGDNPWKIAKQFNVNFEDIVRLNHLDEERARNLKAGERIRVK